MRIVIYGDNILENDGVKTKAKRTPTDMLFVSNPFSSKASEVKQKWFQPRVVEWHFLVKHKRIKILSVVSFCAILVLCSDEDYDKKIDRTPSYIC